MLIRWAEPMIEHPRLTTHDLKLRLYVAGDTAGARRALDSRRLLLQASGGEIEIEIVDIFKHPEIAEIAGILATPTLSDETNHPPRRLIGDISNIAQVLEFFGHRKKEGTP
jgi:circadian clock protein KaiB